MASDKEDKADFANELGKAVENVTRIVSSAVTNAVGNSVKKMMTEDDSGNSLNIKHTSNSFINTCQPKIISILDKLADKIDKSKTSPELNNKKKIEAFNKYRDKITGKIKSSVQGIIGNAAALGAFFIFDLGNKFLAILNIHHNGIYILPLLFSLGIVSNIVSFIVNNSYDSKLKQMLPPNLESLDLIKKLHSLKEKAITSIPNALFTSSILFTINMAVTHHFFWAPIPSLFIAIGAIRNVLLYNYEKKKIEQSLFEKNGVSNWQEFYLLKDNIAEGPFAADALVSRSSILNSIKSSPVSKDFDDKLISSLDIYVKNIIELEQSLKEIDLITASIPMAELQADKNVLLQKLNSTNNTLLKAEYEVALAEIKKQESACNDLSERREFLWLKLKSAQRLLQQLKLNITKLQNTTITNKDQSWLEINKSMNELNLYFTDLETGYSELTRN